MHVLDGRVCSLVGAIAVGLVAGQAIAANDACCEPDGSCWEPFRCHGRLSGPGVCLVNADCSTLPNVLCKEDGQTPCIYVDPTCWDVLNCEVSVGGTQPTPEEPETVRWAENPEEVCRADDRLEEIEE